MKLPLEMLYHWEKTIPNQIYLKQPLAGQVHEFTWAAAANSVRRMAQHLDSLGLPPGSHIAIASKNCAEWILADLAIWMSGHVSVPLYPNLTTNTVKEILDHSEAKCLFFGKLDAPDTYRSAIAPGLKCIAFKYNPAPGMALWDDIIRQTPPKTESPTRTASELATIIYTSGTTGRPKGVMHKFQSFSHAATVILEELELAQGQRFFSYLPLAHVAERVLTETLALYGGSTVSFAESLDTFSKNLADTKPTIFLGVPRIWEKFQAGIWQKLPPHKMDKLLKIPGLSSIIKRKIRKGLGLDKAKICVSGAAPISLELLKWFDRLGIEIREAYGLTENMAFSHFNVEGRRYFGSVGKPWPTVTVGFEDTGELTMESPCLMEGYFKSPEQTAEMLRNGKLYTGDQARTNEDGYLYITGRVKDLFKTSKGKYVAPSPIELILVNHVFVEQACVVGSALAQPMALVTLKEAAKSLEGSELKDGLQSLLEQTNQTLEPHERLSRIVVVREAWTVENEFLTPTMKLKRNKVEATFQDSFRKWESQDARVILL